MNAYRKMMIARRLNIGWCKPYFSQNGRVQFTMNEGVINSLCVDNKYVPADNPNHFVFYREDTLKKAARMVNERYDSFSDSEMDQMILEDEIYEGACCDCPWFYMCERMNDFS